MADVLTGVVRASFVNIFQPKSINGSTPKYSISLIIPKSDKVTIGKINAAIEEAKQLGITNKWNNKLPPNLKLPLRDGDVERPDDPAYAASYFINANNTKAPTVIDCYGKEIVDPLRVYSGCYVKAIVSFYPFNTSGNRGVGVSLQGVQHWEDGEPLNGRPDVKKMFGVREDVEEEDYLN